MMAGNDTEDIVCSGGPLDGEQVDIHRDVHTLCVPDYDVRRPAERPDGVVAMVFGQIEYRDSGCRSEEGRRIFTPYGRRPLVAAKAE